MKLLILQDWNPLRGGAERYTLDLRDALVEAGDEVSLLTADVSPEAPQVADHLAHASDHAVVKSLLQVHNPFAAATVRRVVRQLKPDVGLVNMFALYLSPSAVNALDPVPYVLLIADYKCTCPLGHRLLPDRSVCRFPQGIACLHQGCLSAPHWLRDQLRYRRIRSVIGNAAAVVSTSNALRDGLAEQGIESRCIHLFSNPPISAAPRRPAASPQLLYLGRLDVEKGVDTLLRAFAICRQSVPQCRLRIVGRGAARGELEQLVTTLGLSGSVVFCGWQERERIDLELGEAWALVAPSRWPEPFGLVALEAIFRGVPAVVPDQGGFAETVDHGVTGLLYPPGDIAALADVLVSVATGARFADHRIAPAAVAQAQRQFGRDRHVSLLRSILDGARSGVSDDLS